MNSFLSKLLASMREEQGVEKTATAPTEPTTAVDPNQQDVLAVAGDVTARIGNFLQAGQLQAEPAGAATPDGVQVDPSMQDASGSGNGPSTRVQLEIPQGMTIKLAGEITNREDALKLIVGLLPEAILN